MSTTTTTMSPTTYGTATKITLRRPAAAPAPQIYIPYTQAAPPSPPSPPPRPSNFPRSIPEITDLDAFYRSLPSSLKIDHAAAASAAPGLHRASAVFRPKRPRSSRYVSTPSATSEYAPYRRPSSEYSADVSRPAAPTVEKIDVVKPESRIPEPAAPTVEKLNIVKREKRIPEPEASSVPSISVTPPKVTREAIFEADSTDEKEEEEEENLSLFALVRGSLDFTVELYVDEEDELSKGSAT